jgi:hypothetical protein
MTMRTLRRASVILLAIAALESDAALAQARAIQPVLAFPEPGLDDPAAYQGYQTRFFRDATGNTVQVYLDARSGRVVTLLADAVNESVGFTVRDATGRPLRLEWGSQSASASGSGARRTIEYQLLANARQIEIGWLLLGSMRVERDLQYSGRHLQPFGSPTFRVSELESLIANVARLDSTEQGRHLRLLNARAVSDLRRRLYPVVISIGTGGARGVTVTQPAFDGRMHLQLDLRVDPREATVVTSGSTISIRARNGSAIRFTVGVTTDAPSLTPLTREQIFNADFLRFLADARAAADRITQGGIARTASDSAVVARFRRLERDARGVELLSAREKLMAGLPNYATYFGRDMMMTALMMEPIWSAAMAEHVIASVLRKLGPGGDVSHEEALGGQAIRENAAEYNAHLAEYFRLSRSGDRARADSALRHARAILADLQKVRENYHMLDDEFQLPVLAARYLGNPSVPPARKLAFLVDSSDGNGPRVAALMRELALVSKLAAPYARDSVVQNLVASPRLDATRWRSVSWRDSNAGYANGRFAMDINAIWVPRALEAISEILSALSALGFTPQQISAFASGSGQTRLADFIREPVSLGSAIQAWNGAVRHFVVSLSAAEIRAKVEQKLGSLPAEERTYWQGVLAATGADRQPLEFLALSLDATGRPIPVVNTDPATWLFLYDQSSASVAARDRAARDVRAFMRVYPVGLFVERLGLLVANDAYASPAVWEAFRKDTYHSPRVVWGREVNLFMLGLAKQISSLVDPAGRPRDPAVTSYVSELRDALRRTTTAVDASGLKHNELWSYEINGGRLLPVRYGVSTDIQLWNVTGLAVQFVLARLPPAGGN